MIRVVARLDIKSPWLIKGVRLEGVRKVGEPASFAQRYYAEGVDELLYMDVVASLYGRNHLTDLVSRTVRDVFVPIAVGGGVRSLEDAQALLRAGADKVAVNTAATERPALIEELASVVGRQSVVLSVEAKRRPSGGGWEALTDNGRNHTGRDVIAWVKEAVERGAGEILLTSVDQEGTRQGFDLELLAGVRAAVDVPIIVSGGLGCAEHAVEAARAGADAIAVADYLHYERGGGIAQIKEVLRQAGFEVRS